MKGILYKTKATVIGPIQYSTSGQDIRKYFTKELKKLGITVFDHFNKPFIDKHVKEGDKMQAQWKEWLKQGEYDKIAAFHQVRDYDLNLVARSDFIIFNYIPGVPTVGTFEELFLANNLNKTIFVIIEGGKHLVPIWLLWTLNHNYFYGSKEECLEMIKKINSGKVKISSDKWKLLQKSFR